IGTTHGLDLALNKYIPEHKSGSEGVIINISSLTGVQVFPFTPVYGATKSAVASLTIALGNKILYDQTKVKVIAVAPGLTTTPILNGLTTQGLNDYINKVMASQLNLLPLQTVDVVGENLMKVIKEKPSGSVWILNGPGEPNEFHPSIPTYEVNLK
ncbi:hypothetical protein WA026_010788, partial [Henosepilachna vigintioctopunctata]